MSGPTWVTPYTRRGRLRRNFSLFTIPVDLVRGVSDGERWLVRLTLSSGATGERVCAVTSGHEVSMPAEWQRDLENDVRQSPNGGATFALLERVSPGLLPTSGRPACSAR
jgi:hypothetical protein